jgi:hypothetical protein
VAEVAAARAEVAERVAVERAAAEVAAELTAERAAERAVAEVTAAEVAEMAEVAVERAAVATELAAESAAASISAVRPMPRTADMITVLNDTSASSSTNSGSNKLIFANTRNAARLDIRLRDCGLCASNHAFDASKSEKSTMLHPYSVGHNQTHLDQPINPPHIPIHDTLITYP